MVVPPSLGLKLYTPRPGKLDAAGDTESFHKEHAKVFELQPAPAYCHHEQVQIPAVVPH
jgi:hypothetical protein